LGISDIIKNALIVLRKNDEKNEEDGTACISYEDDENNEDGRNVSHFKNKEDALKFSRS